MDKKYKIIILVVAVAAISVGGYFILRYIKLKKAYDTFATEDDILKIVEEKTKDIGDEMEVDPDLPPSAKYDETGITADTADTNEDY
jgi:uncharacterized protein (UPF0333 family)